MYEDLLDQAAALKSQGQPFVLATVVGCQPPTSAKPGVRAIIKDDGSFTGWVGGSCAQPLVTQESLKVLQHGQPRLLLLAPDPTTDLQLEGLIAVPMTCQSDGTLAIYLEPFLPPPQLVIIGQSPTARCLTALGRTLGFRVWASDPAASRNLFPDAEDITTNLNELKSGLRPGSYVVVATMGHYDEEALEAAAEVRAAYLGLVASPRRGRAVLEYLRGKDMPSDALKRIKVPAGLDIGAITPEEIALSILTEIVQHRRSRQETEPNHTPGASSQPVNAVDPVCHMTINVAEARYSLPYGGGTVYFCCVGCQQAFDREPARYTP